MKQKKRILVVEDNALERSVLCEILKNEYQVIEAENGQVALDILKENANNIALVLLDIRMPVMDGYEFLEHLKQDVNLVKIPVIVLTMSDKEEDEILALEYGATDYIPKPYKPVVILHRVASLIRLQEATSMIAEVQYDKLTGLYTKETFYLKVKECLDCNPDVDYTILCTNLENFKLYNDVFGWKAGDKLLVEVAHTLQQRVGDLGICCRYSADRFLFLLETELEREGRDRLIEKRKIKRSELTDSISSKLGIYEITDRKLSVEQMCDRAIIAVNSIKGLYNQHYAIYSDVVREKMHRENEIADAMVAALKEKQFTLYFQPKYNLYDNCIIGAEALVRWEHPEMGFMSPAEFIPLFEKNGFIHYLDQYVWELTCEFLKKCKDRNYPLVPISVNVSRADFYMTDLEEVFDKLLDKYDINPALLHLEITESAYISDNSEKIIDSVARLRKKGFIVEMDDFGSGYSSLNMFSQMDVDVLKLDMKFISSELSKPMEQSILSDVINMAHRMHLDVVAEGVETSNQMLRLKRFGCDCAQGYYFAKPMDADEFEHLLFVYGSMLEGLKEEDGLYIQSLKTKELDGIKKTVLIVEDEPLNRELLAEIISDNYIVVTAENGEEGLRILEKCGQYISAILLDIQMPVMDGYEFLTHLKENPVLYKIPVIVTTALDTVKDEERCLQLGATDFIAKPYNASLLLMRLNAVIQLREFDGIISELEIDALTGFKNRKAYYEDIALIEQHPQKSNMPIGVVFADINGLKQINDSEGHEAGDRLIIEVANTIRFIFGDAKIYRLGGDEFVLLAFEESETVFNDKIKALKRCWRDEKSAAIGSVWLEKAKDLEYYVSVADQEMYRDKSMYYEKKHHENRRNQDISPSAVLMKVDEVSEFLPGGFFIYKADDTREVISFNSELLKLYGCDTEEEFRQLTGNSFRGMVHPDDFGLVESDISLQINENNDIDYVEYRIVCKDGSIKKVRDYGRFVHTELYGDVYYVFINDIA